MCKECGNCAKEHRYDALEQVDFAESSIFI
jgi:hypothetical protein